MNKVKFYVCARCGNIIEMVKDTGVNPFCCGQKMDELVPNTVEASGEKHIPAVTVNENTVEVNVGSVDHPMIDVHWIEWVQLVTENGIQRKVLNPGDAPKATFWIGPDDEVVAAYEYCNLHGLWKA